MFVGGKLVFLANVTYSVKVVFNVAELGVGGTGDDNTNSMTQVTKKHIRIYTKVRIHVVHVSNDECWRVLRIRVE